MDRLLWALKVTGAIFAVGMAMTAVLMTGVALGGVWGLVAAAVVLVFGILWFVGGAQ